MTAKLITGKNYYLGHNRRNVIYAGLSNQGAHQFLFISSLDSNIEVTQIGQDDLLYVDELKTAFDINNAFYRSRIVSKNMEDYDKVINIIQEKK